MSVEKRYQVFVSSTYVDLVDERKEVMQALLELDCIPSGMELFQAADDDQWTLIKRVIDDCDYYLVIVAGRYGSVNLEGLSFTEMEYRYALQIGKPVVAFLHETPEKITAEKSESSPEGRERLATFRTLCEKKVVKYWTSPEGLGSVVSRSVIRLIKDRPAVGWVRGDTVTSDEAAREILSLRKTIDDLRVEVKSEEENGPQNIAHLVQISDEFDVKVVAGYRSKRGYGKDFITFNAKLLLSDLLKVVGPYLMDEVTESKMAVEVDEYFQRKFIDKVRNHEFYEDRELLSLDCDKQTFQQIKIQLVALGIIEKGDKRRAPSDRSVYWKLSRFGEKVVLSTMARRKFQTEEGPDQTILVEE